MLFAVSGVLQQPLLFEVNISLWFAPSALASCLSNASKKSHLLLESGISVKKNPLEQMPIVKEFLALPIRDENMWEIK